MMNEIERKFLVTGNQWRSNRPRTLRQGYLCLDPERTVRVRLDDNEGTLTIKGKSHGATRVEYEYAIPSADARQLLDTLCRRPLIEKHRHVVFHGGKRWEVDEFFGDNQGLVVAEIELADEQESFARPDWLGCEVTHEPRYFNAQLTEHPYCRWQDDVTYLEMTEYAFPRLSDPPNTEIELCDRLSVDQYLALYNGVGRDYGWVDRSRQSPDQLAAILRSPRVWVHRLRCDGEVAGFSELDGRHPSEIQLVYFGLFPKFTGRGLGPWFLHQTLQFAWQQKPDRIWLQTCAADHPAARRTYERAGFRPM